jgi:hypothetical protein
VHKTERVDLILKWLRKNKIRAKVGINSQKGHNISRTVFLATCCIKLIGTTNTQTPCELEMYLVQAIIGVNSATVAAGTFMATNNSYRNTLLHTILQLNAEQAVIKQWDFKSKAKPQDPTLVYQPNKSACIHQVANWSSFNADKKGCNLTFPLPCACSPMYQQWKGWQTC